MRVYLFALENINSISLNFSSYSLRRFSSISLNLNHFVTCSNTVFSSFRSCNMVPSQFLDVMSAFLFQTTIDDIVLRGLNVDLDPSFNNELVWETKSY